VKLGKPRVCVLYTVDAVNAGQGDLDITVNGGTVPCTVISRGNRRLHASFTPRAAVPHDVEVRFNGQEVAGMLFQFFTKVAFLYSPVCMFCCVT